MDPRLFHRARADGNLWITNHFTVSKPNGFLHYYLYALERYETFRDAENPGSARLGWYEQGARFLLETQRDDGSWESQAKNPPDTCFALLFLLRSAKKSLDRTQVRYREGILVAGQGLPAADAVRLRDGDVRPAPADRAVDECLSLLETDASGETGLDFERAVEALADLAESGDPAVVDLHGAALARLTRHVRRDVRRAAAAALGRATTLDHAAALVAALEDEDVQVLLAARDALCALARRPSSVGPEVRSSAVARRKAIDDWKSWLRALKPAAVLE
jgi:hypothetical protein